MASGREFFQGLTSSFLNQAFAEDAEKINKARLAEAFQKDKDLITFRDRLADENALQKAQAARNAFARKVEVAEGVATTKFGRDIKLAAARKGTGTGKPQKGTVKNLNQRTLANSRIKEINSKIKIAFDDDNAARGAETIRKLRQELIFWDDARGKLLNNSKFEFDELKFTPPQETEKSNLNTFMQGIKSKVDVKQKRGVKDNPRNRAIDDLNEAGISLTEENINEAIRQRNATN